MTLAYKREKQNTVTVPRKNSPAGEHITFIKDRFRARAKSEALFHIYS